MIKPREKMPELTIDLVNDTQWSLSEQKPKQFTMLVVYRGNHCPVCKKYLEELQRKLTKFIDKGIHVIAVSSDTEAIAKQTYEEWAIADLPVGHNFSIEQARALGLYISKGIKKEPDVFIEPGLFLINPDQTLYAVSIQSMPFARPEFDALLKAIDFVIEEDYPARGEA
ncbi:peroxiredoxin-like family protein [Lacinutrix neustonica]|uniref:Peroxiredoxin-like family protein n=1 Tax=Lacinutrix neustonica TaxID=2980107 RepID=A0A9E8MW24_9FLAO|nr:peroxiredoxin-like family protein [Lacinutrix neustonica]WAC02411.1 peroxiredoxin-like family protein [Lacinutrix neustonica]